MNGKSKPKENSDGWKLYKEISLSLDKKGNDRGKLLLILSMKSLSILRSIRNDEMENFNEFDFDKKSHFLRTSFKIVEDDFFKQSDKLFDIIEKDFAN